MPIACIFIVQKIAIGDSNLRQSNLSQSDIIVANLVPSALLVLACSRFSISIQCSIYYNSRSHLTPRFYNTYIILAYTLCLQAVYSSRSKTASDAFKKKALIYIKYNKILKETLN